MTHAAHERRLLILAPTRKDAILTESLLASADVPCLICSTIADVAAAVDEGAAAVLIAEEMIVGGARCTQRTFGSAAGVVRSASTRAHAARC